MIKNTIQGESIVEETTIDLREVLAVSYTHLDVYKRQATISLLNSSLFVRGAVFMLHDTGHCGSTIQSGKIKKSCDDGKLTQMKF